MAQTSLPLNNSNLKICAVDGCGSTHRMCRGWCRKHYERWFAHGDPTRTRNNRPEGETPEMYFWSKVKITANPDKCWQWTGYAWRGYGTHQYHRKNYKAHRLAWFLVKGFHPQLFLLHSCDNRGCVNPNHLREGTAADNSADMVSRNRQAKGLRVTHTAKLTGDEVRAIKYSTTPTKEIAKRFNCSASCVYRIRRGESWKHI